MSGDERQQRTGEPALRDLDLRAHLADPSLKQRYVTTMFDLVAPRYDRFTRRFSFGMDTGWKRELIGLLAQRLPPNGTVVDLACGTGDLALAAAQLVPQGRTVGLDVSRRMLRLAEARARQRRPAPRYVAGDLLALPLPTASADAVTVGYGIRNTPDYDAALAEIARVLRPGGSLLTLDFYRPGRLLWRRLFLRYLRLVGLAYGWLWHREPEAYGYIAPSVEQFLTAGAFTRALEERGFTVTAVREKLGGGVAIHLAHNARRDVAQGARRGRC